MITELTFAILKYGFLALLWVFVWMVMRSLRRDVEIFSPRKSRAHRKSARRASKAAVSPAPTALNTPKTGRASVRRQKRGTESDSPTLLTIIDGPLAGTSVPLNGTTVTLGRSASNTVVLDDEFVSSQHARVYQDPVSNSWAIEDLGSTNGTVVNHQRLTMPVVLHAGVPVRIGATTFELR